MALCVCAWILQLGRVSKNNEKNLTMRNYELKLVCDIG